MSTRILFLLGAAAALLAAPVRAFTPESGLYWNPAEGGSGLNIEIQDNFLALTAYVYAANGQATWYTAQGVMTRDGVVRNDYFSGQLDAFTNGQCIGCAYRAPTPQLGAGGPVIIQFLSETTATLTWGNRTMPIERFDFYLTRGAAQAKTELMLGEWQVVLDLYDRGGTYRDYPYYGEVLSFDLLDTTANPDQFGGCRPTSTEAAACSTTAREDHPAFGFYDTQQQEHVIVVTDVPDDDASDEVFFAYYVNTGTYQFDGVFEICARNQCGSASASYYPVRGFRTASRSFVQTGRGPSHDEKSFAPGAGLLAQLAKSGTALPRGLTRAEVITQFAIDPTLHAASVSRLQESARR